MKKHKYDIRIRIPQSIYKQMLTDLKRPHPFAFERVGFLFTKSKIINEKTVLIIATDYIPVDDNDYVKDSTVGAKFDSASIRKAMQGTHDRKSGALHVHLHRHSGNPSPSFTDMEGLPGVVHSLSNIASKQANGFLILSEDRFYAEIKIGQEKKFHHVQKISLVGYPMKFQFLDSKIAKGNTFNRQSFLGEVGQVSLENVTVGIIGYGGGGSHIGQQLAHLGVKNIVVFDGDIVEDTNLNRLIGAWFIDIKRKLLKTSIAKRTIKKILPSAKVNAISCKWQQNPEILQNCDIIWGCVDSYLERQQLEVECRRYLIPYIDIGMDVFKKQNNSYSMSGQVILSMPGSVCMNCYGFLNEEDLRKETEKYGDAGGRPQVVWANGVLASTAVGVLVDMITGWTGTENMLIYLSYDGNAGLLNENVRKRFAPVICNHFPLQNTGPTLYQRL